MASGNFKAAGEPSIRGVMRMWRLGVVLLLQSASAYAQSDIDRSLAQLDPETRLEQICSLEAMRRINSDKNPHHPDRAVIYAISKPAMKGDLISGDGGAFRSRGKWYQFSYTCRTSTDHMRVSEFTYQFGAPIPEDKWDDYGLWR